MPIEGMNHFTVLTSDLEATTHFYVDVLGLVPGPRPDMGFPGVWLYIGKQPALHVIAGRIHEVISAGQFGGGRVSAPRFDIRDHPQRAGVLRTDAQRLATRYRRRGIVTAIECPDREGRHANVVLGFDDLAGAVVLDERNPCHGIGEFCWVQRSGRPRERVAPARRTEGRDRPRAAGLYRAITNETPVALPANQSSARDWI